MEKVDDNRTVYTTIRNRQTLFSFNVTRTQPLENIATTGRIIGSSSRGRRGEIMNDTTQSSLNIMRLVMWTNVKPYAICMTHTNYVVGV